MDKWKEMMPFNSELLLTLAASKKLPVLDRTSEQPNTSCKNCFGRISLQKKQKQSARCCEYDKSKLAKKNTQYNTNEVAERDAAHRTHCR